MYKTKNDWTNGAGNVDARLCAILKWNRSGFATGAPTWSERCARVHRVAGARAAAQTAKPGATATCARTTSSFAPHLSCKQSVVQVKSAAERMMFCTQGRSQN